MSVDTILRQNDGQFWCKPEVITDHAQELLSLDVTVAKSTIAETFSLDEKRRYAKDPF